MYIYEDICTNSTAQFKLYTHGGYICVPACLPHVNFITLTFTHIVAHNFGIHMPASEYIQHTSDAHQELAHGFTHYMCGVQVH